VNALRRRPGLRFLAEAVLIVLVTVVTGVLHLGPWGIGGAAAIVWLTYVVIEYSLAHPREEKKPAPELVERLPEPELERPRSDSVRVITRPPDPEPVAEPEPVAAEPEPDPTPVAVEPELEPEPEPTPLAVEPDEVPDTVPVSATPSDSPRELPPDPQQWNVWELERGLRESGESTEEREFLLIYLRDYAGPDGLLPLDFDDLVRESFPDVVGTPTG
jgi:hypothetical protein